MSFKYSSFLSYRRNLGDEPFVKNFKSILETEAQKVTNIQKAFFDEISIDWASDFDTKIYTGIFSSYFFIPIYYSNYLHEDNLWCAREIYHAIEIEKKLRETYNDFCFILPIIYRGTTSDLPSCLGKKNAKTIRQLETTIINKKSTSKLTDFKHEMYDILSKNFKLIESENLNLSVLCSTVHIPTDEELKQWIKQQKGIQKKQESQNLPILTKNG
jgi:hypothetical protein